jgi:hypothetical protein
MFSMPQRWQRIGPLVSASEATDLRRSKGNPKPNQPKQATIKSKNRSHPSSNHPLSQSRQTGSIPNRYRHTGLSH